MENILSALQSLNFEWETFVKVALVLAAASLIFGLIGKFFFSKESNLNLAVSSAIGILFIYALIIVIYSAGEQFRQYVLPLPFAQFSDSTLTIFSFQSAHYTEICSQILSMIILAFLVNLIDGFLPKGDNVFTWFLLRILVIIFATLLHAGSVWLQVRFVPEGLLTYAPTILLGLLVLLLAVGALKPVVGLLLAATAHPLIGAFYTFFFATIIGKALTKAVMTTTILCLIVYVLGYMGIAAISIASAALIAYIPLLLVLLIVWYVVNKIF